MSQIKQRKKLTTQLEKFASGRWTGMLAGGRELLDITDDWIAGLDRRVKAIDRSIAAHSDQAR